MQRLFFFEFEFSECGFCKISKTTFFTEHLPTTASINYSFAQKNCSYKFKCMILKPPKDSRDYAQSKEILISIFTGNFML